MNIADKITCKVPFGTVTIPEKSKQLINECLDTKMVTNGKLVREFEQKFAEKFGVAHAVAVSSGTDADTLALASLYDLGAQRGDEVLIPALTFVATANAVVNAGFKPVFIDVDKYSLNIDVNVLDRYITRTTRAIMPVHLMGKPADMNRIMEVARKYNLNVIEDAAEAHGAEYYGQKVGTIAPISCFSCYAAHIITSIEGGMILTKSDYIAESLRSLRNHGLQHYGSDWGFKRIGFSSKMNELEAAVGIGNIELFDSILLKRRFNYLYLLKKFNDFIDYMYTIYEDSYIDEIIAPHAFPIILKENCPFTKEQLVKHLTKCGIDNRNLFYSIPTQTEAYQYQGYSLGAFPNSEYLSNHGTHIGCHQDLTVQQLDYVIDCIKEFIKQHVQNK